MEVYAYASPVTPAPGVGLLVDRAGSRALRRERAAGSLTDAEFVPQPEEGFAQP
jgi:hypothetical protein